MVIVTLEDEFITIEIIYFGDCKHIMIFKKMFCVIKVANLNNDSDTSSSQAQLYDNINNINYNTPKILHRFKTASVFLQILNLII